MKIKNKIIFNFFGLFLIFVVAMFVFVSYYSSEIIKKKERSFLETATHLEKKFIQHWISSQKDRLKLILDGEDAFCQNLNMNKNDPKYKEGLDECGEKLNYMISGSFEDIFILNSNGEPIKNHQEKADLRNDFSQALIFEEGKKKVFFGDFYYNKESTKKSFGVAGPIENKQTGDFMGVLVVKLKSDDLLEAANAFPELVQKGRSYLINEDAKLISYSGGGQWAVPPGDFVDNKATRACIKEIDSGDKTYPEDRSFVYSGFNEGKALGAYEVLPEKEWCLVSEVDESFILKEVRNIQYLLAGFSLISFFVYFLLAFLISRSITKPIEDLRRGAEKIKKGDYTYKVGIKSRDEIGKLSRSFDSMVRTMDNSLKEVDKKVKNQTKKLKEKREDLMRQQKAILNILEDVQEEKTVAEEARERIKTILYSIGDGVFVIDEKKDIFIFNNMASKISGFEEEEVLGRNFEDVLNFINEETGEQRRGFIDSAIKKGEVVELKKGTALVKKDGNKVPVADSASPIKDKEGNFIGCVVVFRDITRDREVDKAKTEFVSLASHQLRTPLSTINWYAEMLLNGDAGEITDDQRMYLDEIYKGNQRMVELVNALLNVSRIELGKLAVDVEKTDFREVADTVIGELKQKIDHKKIDFKKEYDKDLPKINADPKLVSIIFQNLLSNAVKYTPEGGGVKLEVSKKDEKVLIKVSDTGYGIPREQHKNIFQKMFRADNVREKDTEGTGLGLYLVKSIVDYAGGEIWFNSEKDKGTTFFIEMPLSGMKVKKGSRELAD
ncbi:MAG: ATP-binding protein [Candidatus Moraniibacteriota bacterium]